jgi:tartrate-resistant acid phosphatase type 5
MPWRRRLLVRASILAWGFLLLTACWSQNVPPLLSASRVPSLTATLDPLTTPFLPTIKPSAVASPTNTDIPPAPTEIPDPVVIRFAVIGDYGGGGQPEADVASLVKSWEPEFIITTGDNNYPSGAEETIDQNIGQFFHEFIAPYSGKYGEGASENQFFPSLGNHDWDTLGAQPYLEYFTLPGNERYYQFVRGPVHFFALDSDSREPDGVGASSPQATWLQEQLADSTSPWKIVYFHQAPYSSGLHGPVNWMRWPFAEWGVDFVLSGHNHTYERLHRNGVIYFVNGLGGGSIYPFPGVEEGSQVRYNEDYGAMLVEAADSSIRFQFITRQNEVIDDFEFTDQE